MTGAEAELGAQGAAGHTALLSTGCHVLILQGDPILSSPNQNFLPRQADPAPPPNRHPNATRFKQSPEPPAQPAAPLLGSPPRVAPPHSSCLAGVSGFPLTFSYSLPHLSGTSLGSASHLRPAAGCSSTCPLSSPGSRHHHPHPNPGCRLLRARVLPATCSSLQHKVRESPLLSPAQRILTSVPEKPRGPGVPRTRCGDPRLLPSAHFPTSSPASQLLPRHARRGPPRGLCTCRPRRPQPSALPSSPRWEFSSGMSGKPSATSEPRAAMPPRPAPLLHSCYYHLSHLRS